MKIAAVIPARYDSTRLAGKVLLKETGKYLIQHTYERACQAKMVDSVVIATDNEKVCAACEKFGAKWVMTSKGHKSGTDRIAQAVENINADIIINIQGDEPEIDPAYIDKLAELMKNDPDVNMATLIAPFAELNDVLNPDIVKCIIDANGFAIYFSRLAVPYSRDNKGLGALDSYRRHLGIYAYKKDFLKTITSIEQTPLEKLEKLEQLRVIENGYKIMTATVEKTSDGIDTPEQYAAFVKAYNNKQ